jgi:N-acetylneuraminate synthase
MTPLRDLFTKSIVAKTNLAAGTVLGQEHLTVKKPGAGIPAARLTEFLGNRLRRALKVDEMLSEADVERI